MTTAPDWICWEPKEWHALAHLPPDPKAPDAEKVAWCGASVSCRRVHRQLSPGEAAKVDPGWRCLRCLAAMAGVTFHAGGAR